MVFFRERICYPNYEFFYFNSNSCYWFLFNTFISYYKAIIFLSFLSIDFNLASISLLAKRAYISNLSLSAAFFLRTVSYYSDVFSASRSSSLFSYTALNFSFSRCLVSSRPVICERRNETSFSLAIFKFFIYSLLTLTI